jgi:hypothetical protein
MSLIPGIWSVVISRAAINAMGKPAGKKIIDRPYGEAYEA